MPIIRGNAKHQPPVITVSILPALPRPQLLGVDSGLHGPQGVTCRALLDTGADGTSVSRNVASAAGLVSRGKQLVTGIGGQNYHRSWAAYIGVYADDESPAFPIILDEPFLAIELPFYPAFEVIIGRDILMKGTFILRPNGDFEWNVPLA